AAAGAHARDAVVLGVRIAIVVVLVLVVLVPILVIVVVVVVLVLVELGLLATHGAVAIGCRRQRCRVRGTPALAARLARSVRTEDADASTVGAQLTLLPFAHGIPPSAE